MFLWAAIAAAPSVLSTCCCITPKFFIQRGPTLPLEGPGSCPRIQAQPCCPSFSLSLLVSSAVLTSLRDSSITISAPSWASASVSARLSWLNSRRHRLKMTARARVERAPSLKRIFGLRLLSAYTPKVYRVSHPMRCCSCKRSTAWLDGATGERLRHARAAPGRGSACRRQKTAG
jgi:hypothetical protein